MQNLPDHSNYQNPTYRMFRASTDQSNIIAGPSLQDQINRDNLHRDAMLVNGMEGYSNGFAMTLGVSKSYNTDVNLFYGLKVFHCDDLAFRPIGVTAIV